MTDTETIAARPGVNFFDALLGFSPGRRLTGVRPDRPALMSEESAVDFAAADFEQLFLEHYPRLVRILIRLVGNSGQAEELAADAFYRYHRHQAEEGNGSNPAGWLYRTAMNLGLDALRANSRRCRREEKAQREAVAAASAGNPLYELLAEEQRNRVRNVLCLLKPVEGQVLLMGSSGFSCKEIAGLLGMRADSLYVLISRARARFEREYVNLYGRSESWPA
jgi:RNA polymerase sigma-70 factor (ECF subfamily)